MKKNKTMRAASILLVLTLMTSCFVGGTFAKYTTATTGTDKARVAYWGFDQDATTTIDLFDDVYGTTVDSENGDNVIAPGTSKTATFAFGYTPKDTAANALNAGAIAAPEVDYTFTVNPTITGDYDALDANANFVWTLQKGSGEVTNYNNVADLLAAIKKLSGDATGTKVYDAGQLPDAFTAADEKYTIGWNWAYHTSAEADAIDTAMGNAQDLDDVTFTITISAEQVD